MHLDNNSSFFIYKINTLFANVMSLIPTSISCLSYKYGSSFVCNSDISIHIALMFSFLKLCTKYFLFCFVQYAWHLPYASWANIAWCKLMHVITHVILQSIKWKKCHYCIWLWSQIQIPMHIFVQNIAQHVFHDTKHFSAQHLNVPNTWERMYLPTHMGGCRIYSTS